MSLHLEVGFLAWEPQLVLNHLTVQDNANAICIEFMTESDTYDHRQQKIRDPVRSPLVNLLIAGLVLRSVTTGESPVLYVLYHFFLGVYYYLRLSERILR